jgi:xylan 1,4-beta-xylosidase
MRTATQTAKQYTNPILSGFYPDPSICRVGGDYYLVNSTFAYFPGIPVFHSNDLVNWKLIGHVMSRTEQMDLTGMGVSRAIFAPTIRYHNGLLYVTCTIVDGKENFVVTAKDPAGPWSNPVWLPEIIGIDPSPFFDEDGKAYIVYNSIPPDDKPLYDGHRTIRINSFDSKNLKIISDNRILVNGGTDISQKPSWIEGPHLIKKYGYYYLVAAEGGTYENHSVVVFRSKTLDGPFVPYDKNPILTQRHLGADRANPISSAGHADLVELPNGEWQAVFLATRPYDGTHYNTGRETFLTPVKWIDEWPQFNPGYEEIQYHYPLPLPEKKVDSHPYSGNFTFRDEFNSTNLHPDWMFLRNPKESWYSIKGGVLSLQLRPQTVMGTDNPPFIARRQQHQKGEASTALSFTPAAENEKAGLLVFQNEDHFYFLCQSIESGNSVVQLYQSIRNKNDAVDMKLLASQTVKLSTGKDLLLKILIQTDTYAFAFSTDGKVWQTLMEGVDARWLSTATTGGFVGCTIGPYASSHGKESASKALFRWFEYKGNDDIYKQKQP